MASAPEPQPRRSDHIVPSSREGSIREEKPAYADEKQGGLEAARDASSTSIGKDGHEAAHAEGNSGKFKALYHRYGGRHIVRGAIAALFTG